MENLNSSGFTSEERLRSLAYLQEKTSALEKEIQNRKKTESTLREVQDEMKQQLEDLQTLHELSSRLIVTTNLESTLEEVLSTVIKIYKTNMGALYLTTPNGEELQRVLLFGVPRSSELNQYQSIGRGVGVPGVCFAEGKSIIVIDVETDTRFPESRTKGLELGIRSVHCNPLFDRSGKPLGVLSVYFKEPHPPVDREIRLVDLHLRQAASAVDAARVRIKLQLDALDLKKIEDSREHLASIVDSAYVVIISKDHLGIITSWNRGAERVFGYAANEIVGKPIFNLIPTEKHEEEHRIVERLRKGEKIEDFETIRNHKNGSLVHVSLTASPIIDENGKFSGVSKIIRDITERKRFENDLQKSEMRFREMADSAPVFVWMSDENGRLTYFNKPWLEFRGRTLEEELGLGWLSALHPDEIESFTKDYALSMPDHISFRMEIRMLRFDGIYRCILNTGTPRFSQTGEFQGFIGSGLDITELKEAEEKLRQAQKMEAIGQLAGGIAHDFNNLLTVINGYSALALRKIEAGDPVHNYVLEVKNAGEKAATLTQQLLAYSRKQILAPKVFNLNDTISQMREMLRHLIGADILLETQLDPNLGLVKVDPGQIHQIILNLILNARDAMPQGGHIKIETSNILLNGVNENFPIEPLFGSFIRLSIMDNGMGMTPEIKAKIFEPFFTTKGVGQGTGLGLSSVYGILKQSGGGIAVTTEPQKGSSFHIFLPQSDLNESRASSIFPISITNPKSRKETILVVEDEETVRKFICHTLSSRGFKVLSAPDGEAALEIVKENTGIDLVLTDVVMPKMNGGKLAEKLKSQFPQLRVLFMSGYTTSTFLSKGLLEPGDFFLQKPFSEAQLIENVNEILFNFEKP